ncbi:kinase-like protein, partial [Obba rivulosa]
GASLAVKLPFLVLKYMPNGDLLQHLQRNNDANRATLLHEVSLGLLFLHSKQIVHGDVKANNVLIDDAGKIFLTNFGLATRYQNITISRGRDPPIGTLCFMVPETISEGRHTYASDIYVFGMLMYEVSPP